MAAFPLLGLLISSVFAQNPVAEGEISGLEQARGAVALTPEDAQAQLELGRSLVRAGRHDEAIESFTAAIALSPTLAPAFEWRGFCHVAKGASVLALADFDQALRLDPEPAWTWFARGDVRAGQRDLRGAAADFAEALKREPDFARAHASLGRLLAATSAVQAAIPHLERALELDPQAGESVHDRLWLRICRVEAGAELEEQDALLRDGYRSGGPGAAGAADGNGHGDSGSPETSVPDWPERLLSFTLGSASYEELDRWMVERDEEWSRRAPPPAVRLCQARFHAGWRLAAAGESKRALYAYLDAVETLAADQMEWEGARSRLRRLAERHAIPAWTGMKLSAPDPEFALLAGVDPQHSQAIVALDPRSMAGRVGLRSGDVILSIEGQPASSEAFGEVLEACRPGDSIRLEVQRGSQRSMFALVLGVRR